MLQRPKTNAEWMPYIGSCGWFHKDGFFECVPHLRPYSQSMMGGSNAGPVFTIVGQKGRFLLISANMREVAQCPKKYTRLIG